MVRLDILAVMTIAMSLGPGSAPAAAEARPVRVMSFNIRFGTAPDGENAWPKRKALLFETIEAFGPDLLGTQETLASQRDELAGRLKGYETLGAGRDDGRDRGEMAALFYRADRFEKLDGGHFWLSETPGEVGSKGWDAALPRIATWVKLRDRADPDGPPLLFLNTHFDHRGGKAREESARLIRRRLAELGKGCRAVVTGDFNAPEGSGPYKALFGPEGDAPSPLVDTFRVAHPAPEGDEGTFTGFAPGRTRGGRIDWIAASRDWDVRLAGIDRTGRDGRLPSDHFPVTAVLRAGGPDAPKTLRVLCYNIHHGEGTDGKVDLPRIAGVIRDADPDLVALQEVDRGTARTGRVDQVAELARLTGLRGLFGRQIDYQGGEYGQAVLSRFPIEPAGLHVLPGEPPREQRLAFEVKVAADGLPLRFATAHLHHINGSFRERQAARLNELFSRGDSPAILAGDMNAAPGSPPIARLLEAWTSAAGGRPLPTYPAESPTKAIDHILIRNPGPLRVVDARVLPEPVASDHRPVLAVFGRAR